MKFHIYFYPRVRLDRLGNYLSVYYKSLETYFDIGDKIKDVKTLVSITVLTIIKKITFGISESTNQVNSKGKIFKKD